MTKMIKQVHRLTFINYAASRWWRQNVEEEIARRLENSWERDRIEDRGKVHLHFLNETYSLFSDPEMAISLGLVEILRNMIEKKFIGPNDYITDHWGEKHRLIQFTVEHIPNLSCFEYLMQVPGIDCSFTYIDIDGEETNLLLFLSQRYELPFVKILLAHPTCPDVNSIHAWGLTPLQESCQIFDEFAQVNQKHVKMLRLLLENGADPTIDIESRDGTNVPLPIEHLRKGKHDYIKDVLEEKADDMKTDWRIRLRDPSDDEYVDPKQIQVYDAMISLLAKYGGQSSALEDHKQPRITDFVTKRRRLC